MDLTFGFGKIRAVGASLVITVDCGISDYDQVLFARDQELDVIGHRPP
jgi:single-stranded DNA-specific DHH superfamily exonuclease